MQKFRRGFNFDRLKGSAHLCTTSKNILNTFVKEDLAEIGIYWRR
jgi:hypothetical protein